MNLLWIEEYQSYSTLDLGDEYSLIASVADAIGAVSRLCDDAYDLIMLDMSGNPGYGFDIIRQLRAGHDRTPLLALTGSLAGDRDKALELGADEAIIVPVDAAELRARMAALARRSGRLSQPVLHLGDLSLRRVTREVRFRDDPIRLTANECALLELMLLNRGTVVSKISCLNHLYDEVDEPRLNIVDVFICKLRKKLERAGALDPIRTIWGQGYMLREPAPRRYRICGNDIGGDRPIIV